MDEHDISAQRLFNELDADGNGVVSITELKVMIEEKYGDELDIDQVNAIMDSADADGDGTLDITEFIGSMEDYETMEELVEEKVFPSPWQKRMMSKSWNDTVWPILHVGFGLLIAIFIANGMFGFVDGSGGNIAYEPNDSGLIPSGNIAEGDIYPCDEKYQKDGCRNSLTPLAGENGSLSMPTNFYWDGIVFIILSAIGMGATLFLHLVKAPEWRARAKAMREFEEDKSDASESSEEEDQGEEDEGVGDEEDDVADDGESYDEEDDVDSEYEDEGDEGDEESDDDIDIGSHIGLVFDDEEVFGKIVEFDDDEGTVTIEEDGTGDLVMDTRKTCSLSEHMTKRTHWTNFPAMPSVLCVAVLTVKECIVVRSVVRFTLAASWKNVRLPRQLKSRINCGANYRPKHLLGRTQRNDTR